LNSEGDVVTPSIDNIKENARILAEYAKKCQSAGIVPIVEPEVVYDGYYGIGKSALVTGQILDALFDSLNSFGVNLRACILKVNMVLAGKQFETQSTPEEVGRETAFVLKNHVPSELAGIVFLSGGQTVEQATDNLAEVIKNGPFPWPVTFSFARALQDPTLFTWQGDNANADAAREAFKARLIANTEVLK
jgi:fructose-bisphosphate aldolase class I